MKLKSAFPLNFFTPSGTNSHSFAVCTLKSGWAAISSAIAFGPRSASAASALGVPIRDSDTEEDCLVHVTLKAPQEESRFFQGLTGAWVQTAYATLPLRRENVVALCNAWPFAGKGGAA